MIELDQIYNEDCLEGMKRIPDASVDCIITDLPYGTTACQWDSVIPFEPLWEQYRRITKPNAAIVLFGSEPFSSALRMSNIKEYRYDWVWDKQKGFGFANANKMPMKQHEIISVFYRRLPTYNPQKTIGKPYKCKGGLRNAVNRGLLTNRVLTDEEKADPTNIKNRSGIATFIRSTVDNKGDRFPGSIISVPREYHDIVHPTQKPVDLLRYLVLTYTNEGDTVLDSCIGSGTTAIACLKERRHFLGFELNKEYFDIAQRRIALERQQPQLDFADG